MSSLEELRSEREKKLELLKEKGINAYPVSVSCDFTVSEVLEQFTKLSKRKKPIKMCGRVLSIRGHGGSVFFDFSDGSFEEKTDGSIDLKSDISEKIQGYAKKDELPEGKHELFLAVADIGDFFEFTGSLFVTKKKEKSLKITDWKIISKSLRPLPSKWYGLQDTEERFRKRYLDILMNDEAKKRFLLRSKITTAIRSFMDKEGFIEVETPLLQPLAGGALAEPFKTHHNALDTDLYLRVAPELYLKKILIGGLNKIYEMGRSFRNEGIDATHNPEFTTLELYESYADANQTMALIEKFLKHVVKSVFGKTNFVFGEHKISVAKKIEVVSYFEIMQRHALIPNPKEASRDDLAVRAKQLGIKVESHESSEKILDNIFSKVIKPKLIQPTFVIDYPVESSPLAKRKDDDKKLIDRFQLVIAGLEVMNGFSELNDPIDQKERFAEQDKAREKGDKDVSPSDEEYLEAMEYGMPPAAGLGIGIDRLVMLLTNTQNIREVVIFPTLKPKK